MELNRMELNALMRLVAKKTEELEKDVVLLNDCLFDSIERGEDTEVIQNQLNVHEEVIESYQRIYNKLEAMKAGAKY